MCSSYYSLTCQLWFTFIGKIGNWENNLQQGQGILHLKDGYRYVGEFVRGQRHGYGKLLMPNSVINVL